MKKSFKKDNQKIKEKNYELQNLIINDVANFHFCNGNGILTEEEKELILNSTLEELENVLAIENYI